MTTNLKENEPFPDIELPDQANRLTRLSQLTLPGLLDQKLGFMDGYRTLRAGALVRFEVVNHPSGPTARNIQPIQLG